MQLALDKLRAMGTSINASRSARGFRSFLHAEFPLFIGLASAAIFLALGSGALEDVDHPLALAGVFVSLFVVVLWSAISVVRHADGLALKCGEPYGITHPNAFCHHHRSSDDLRRNATWSE